MDTPTWAQSPAGRNSIESVGSSVGENSPPAPASRPRLNLRDPALRLSVAEASNSPAARLPAAATAVAPPRRVQRRTVVGTLIGVAVGAAAGIFTGASILLSDDPCQPHCGPRVTAGFAALFGFPILGGVIGHAIAK